MARAIHRWDEKYRQSLEREITEDQLSRHSFHSKRSRNGRSLGDGSFFYFIIFAKYRAFIRISTNRVAYRATEKYVLIGR